LGASSLSALSLLLPSCSDSKGASAPTDRCDGKSDIGSCVLPGEEGPPVIPCLLGGVVKDCWVTGLPLLDGRRPSGLRGSDGEDGEGLSSGDSGRGMPSPLEPLRPDYAKTGGTAMTPDCRRAVVVSAMAVSPLASGASCARGWWWLVMDLESEACGACKVSVSASLCLVSGSAEE
jgi:hypothetical protein